MHTFLEGDSGVNGVKEEEEKAKEKDDMKFTNGRENTHRRSRD